MIRAITLFYQHIYRLRKQLPKQERFGIYATIESNALVILEYAITAAFNERPEKIPVLKKLRITIEIEKRLFRSMYELDIIIENQYIAFEKQLIELSKMTNGWISYNKERV